MKKLMIALAVCSLSTPAFAGKVQNKATEAVKGGVENVQDVAEEAVPEVQEKDLMEKAKNKFEKIEADKELDNLQKAAKEKVKEKAKGLSL